MVTLRCNAINYPLFIDRIMTFVYKFGGRTHVLIRFYECIIKVNKSHRLTLKIIIYSFRFDWK